MIGTEKQQLPGFDRSADGSSILVLPDDGLFLARAIKKEVIRIQRLVPEKLEQGPVQVIGSRFGDDIHVGTGVTSE